MEWIVEKLGERHDRSRFDCGNELLNNFLKHLAGQYSRRKLGQTYAAAAGDDNAVRGYYTISTSSILFENLAPDQSKGLPRSPVPVVLLGRLAVDRNVQRQGLGKTLLVKALRRIGTLATEVGICAVEVHAIDDAARTFYVKFGFTALIDDQRRLYLPVRKIEKLLAL